MNVPSFLTSTAVMVTVGVVPASVELASRVREKIATARINNARFTDKSSLIFFKYNYAEYFAILYSKIPCAAGYKAGSKVNGRIGLSSTRPFGFCAEGANTRALCPGEIVKFMFTNLFELKIWGRERFTTCC